MLKIDLIGISNALIELRDWKSRRARRIKSKSKISIQSNSLLPAILIVIRQSHIKNCAFGNISLTHN